MERINISYRPRLDFLEMFFILCSIFIYPIAQLIQNKAYFSIGLLIALTMHEHVIFIYIVGSHFLELDSKYQFSHVLVCKLHET